MNTRVYYIFTIDVNILHKPKCSCMASLLGVLAEPGGKLWN